MLFSEISVKTGEIASAINVLQSRIVDLGTVASALSEDITELGAAYGDVIAAVGELASGSSDAAILTTKSELDLLVAEYVAAQAKVAATISAITG